MYVNSDDYVDINLCVFLKNRVTQYKEIDVIFWCTIVELDSRSIKRKIGWKSDSCERLYIG
jgi:hypothetical protein